MKKFLVLLAILGMTFTAVPAMAIDTMVAYDQYNGYGYCTPSIMFQAQGIVTDVVINYNNFSFTTSAAAGQAQVMVNAYGSQNQHQKLTYGAITIEQSQYQSTCCGYYGEYEPR